MFVFAAYYPVNEPDRLMYTRARYSEALAFQREYQEKALRLGEFLSTRCTFAGWGDGLYLVRNLYNLRMERYGMLVLMIDRRSSSAP
jgi:hypothetical protein